MEIPEKSLKIFKKPPSRGTITIGGEKASARHGPGGLARLAATVRHDEVPA
jgi:hypothetical protein